MIMEDPGGGGRGGRGDKSKEEMMDFELRRASEKLQREQKEKKKRARLKLERERKTREEAKKQREAIKEFQRAHRLEAIDAQLNVS